MPQGQRERQLKTSVCYFLIGALAPDTAEPWSDASTVIWRIPLVFAALEVPLYRKCDMSLWGQRSEEAVVASVIELYSWQLSADTSLLARNMWPLEPRAAFGEGMSVNKHSSSKCRRGKSQGIATSVVLKPSNLETQILVILSVCCMPDCHVHQQPPPTNGLIWPPPPMVAATSLMPNRPARGLLSEGEGAHAWIPQSNLNM